MNKRIILMTAHRRENPKCWKQGQEAGRAKGSGQSSGLLELGPGKTEGCHSDPSPVADSLLLFHPPATRSEEPRSTLSLSKCTQLTKTQKQRRKLPALHFVNTK